MKKRAINFLKSLKFIFKPSFWFMNYPHSKAWDKKLNDLMDEGRELKILDHYDAKFDGTNGIIWIQNYPYAFATPRFQGECRPSRLTIERFNEYLIRSQMK